MFTKDFFQKLILQYNILLKISFLSYHTGKYGMLENGDLYFRDVTERDSTFSFRCHTENLITREKKVSMNYSKIIVTGKD